VAAAELLRRAYVDEPCTLALAFERLAHVDGGDGGAR
jgi:hypothetical protein